MVNESIPKSPEPVHAGSERETLTEFLDWYRNALIRKADGLDPTQLTVRLGPSTLTIGRLVRHMTMVEDYWFQSVFAGEEDSEPWKSAPWDDDPDWEMTSADGMTFDDLRHDFDRSCEHSRHVVASAKSLELIAARESADRTVSLRWILVHMIEEYARHAGHADLIRESIDGVTGE